MFKVPREETILDTIHELYAEGQHSTAWISMNPSWGISCPKSGPLTTPCVHLLLNTL